MEGDDDRVKEKHFEKSMRALEVLTICLGVIELVLAAGQGILIPAQSVFCIWCLAGSGAVNVSIGMWGFRFLKGREIVQKPETIMVYEDDMVMFLAIGVWLVATAMSFLGITGSLYVKPDRVPLCPVMSLFNVIAFLLILDYQKRRIVLHGNYVYHTSFWGRDRTIHKSEIKEATASIIGSWAVYGSDGKRLFYIEDNMVNARKFMGKMPVIFPLSTGYGKKLR